jgi:hypothetical protein
VGAVDGWHHPDHRRRRRCRLGSSDQVGMGARIANETILRTIQFLLEPGPVPVGVRQGGTDLLNPLGQVRTDRRLSTAHAMVPRVQRSLPLRSMTALPGEPTCPSSPLLDQAIIERLLLPKADGRVADGDSPRNTAQYHPTLDDGHDLPRPGGCCSQGVLLSLDNVGSRV